MPVQSRYCAGCGVKVDEMDLRYGEAVAEGERFLCPACRPAASGAPSHAAGRAPSRPPHRRRPSAVASAPRRGRVVSRVVLALFALAGLGLAGTAVLPLVRNTTEEPPPGEPVAGPQRGPELRGDVGDREAREEAARLERVAELELKGRRARSKALEQVGDLAAAQGVWRDFPAELHGTRTWREEVRAELSRLERRTRVYDGEVHASRRSGKYHRPDCAWVSRIRRDNLKVYASPAEARTAGLTPGQDCLGGDQ